MSAEHTSNPNYKLHKKLMRRRALRESWPLLVWLGVAFLAVWAYQTGGEFQRMRGVVSKPIETVSAQFTGKLVTVPVDNPDLQIPRDDNGQPKKLEQGVFVNAGDVVAMLDDTELRLRIEAERETAQFDRAKLQQELQQHVLDFQDRVFQLQNQEQTLQEQIAGYENLRKRTESEVRNGTALASALEEVQKDINDRTAELAGVRRQIGETQKLVETSIAGIEKLQNQVNTDPNQSATIRLLEEQVKQAVVTTTSAGFIDKIYAKPGSVVKAGDPILDIVVKAPKTITALIPEANALAMKQGDEVYIAIPNNRKEFVTATILALQQSLTQIPDYGSPIRGRMVRGRMVEFGNLEANAEDSQLPLLPGSAVLITLRKPGRIPFLSWFNE